MRPETGVEQSYLDRAIADGLVSFHHNGRSNRIIYVTVEHEENWDDPEEHVRAELWAELIYRCEYPPERVYFEFVVPRRTPADRADIVVFSDDHRKEPYFVFECKPADASDAEFHQAIEQACGNRGNLAAPYCGAVAGTTRRLLTYDGFPPGERDRNHIADIPINYGSPLEWRFYKQTTNDLVAVTRYDLRAAIRKCHQTLWEGGKRSAISAFGEFCKLVFIKHRDEKDVTRQQGSPYKFQRRTKEDDQQLAARIHDLYSLEQQIEPDVFADSINLDASILAQCVEHLEPISLEKTELDTKGVAFEEFVGSFFKGDFGQYFTPRELVAFCVAFLEPQRHHIVLDPACGSSGFLLYTMDYVRRKADTVQPPGSIEHYTYWHQFAERNLFGIEVSEELTRVAKMNMIIHDDGHTNIVGHDALDFSHNLIAKNPRLKDHSFDLVLTNPPFGAVVRRTEKPEGYLEQYQLLQYLGKRYPNPKTRRTTLKTEIAFLERIWRFLRLGSGRAAVVVPDSILTNPTNQGVREWIYDHFQVLAVISLPQFAFNHYDAGVKASIIFLRSLAEREAVPDNQAIFMALTNNIGYDAAGRKTFIVSMEVEDSTNGYKCERHSCDLFDYRVTYERGMRHALDSHWIEQNRNVIPGSGLLEQWQAFQRSPYNVPDNAPVRQDTQQLGGIDGLVLKKMGIVSQTAQACRFRVTVKDVRNGRLDPDFHSTKFRTIRQSIADGIYETKTIGEICEYMASGFAAGPEQQVHGFDVGIPHLRPLNVDIHGRLTLKRTKFVPKGSVRPGNLCQDGEVLFNNTNSTEMVGKAAVFDLDLDCSCSNHMTRLKPKPGVMLSHFLASVLNALRRTGYLGLLSTNFNNQAGINMTTLSELRIPVPPLDIQKSIVDEVKDIRTTAQDLIKRGEKLLTGQKY